MREDRGICLWFLLSPSFLEENDQTSFSIFSDFWCLTVWILVWQLCGHRCVLPAVLGQASCIGHGCLEWQTWLPSPGGHPWGHPDIGANHLFVAAGSWEIKSWDVPHCDGSVLRVPGQRPLISEALLCPSNLECLLTPSPGVFSAES